MLGSDNLTVTHHFYLINTNIFVSSDFAQQIKLMFDLSLGCSCSVCYRKDHERLYCKAIPLPLHKCHTDRDSSHHHLCPLSTPLYGQKCFHFQPWFIYSQSVISAHLPLLSQTSAMLSPKRIYSQAICKKLSFLDFCFSQPFLSTWRLQHHFSACRIICLYFPWAFWPGLEGDWSCTAFHRRWYSPSLNEVRWALALPQKPGHPPSQAVLNQPRTSHAISANPSRREGLWQCSLCTFSNCRSLCLCISAGSDCRERALE